MNRFILTEVSFWQYLLYGIGPYLLIPALAITFYILNFVYKKVSGIGEGFRKVIIHSQVPPAKSKNTNFWYGILFFVVILWIVSIIYFSQKR
jgi:hypothetical protein